MVNSNLDIAFIVEDNEVEKWKYNLITCINTKPYIENIYIINVLNPPKSKTTYLQNGYLKLDHKIYNPQPNAFEIIDLNKSKKYKFFNISTAIEYRTDKTLKHLKELNSTEIDVIIDLTNTKRDLSCFKVPKYGIWYYSFSEKSNDNTYLDGISEMVNKEDVIISKLKMFTKENMETTLFSTKSFVDSFSISKTRNTHFWKSSLFVIRKLDELYFNGEDFLKKPTKYIPKSSFTISSAHTESWVLVKHILFTFFNLIIKEVTKRIYFNQWILMFKISDSLNLKESFKDYKRIIPPKDRIWADPFVYKKDDNYYIFIEEMLLKDNKGFISVMQVDNNGIYSEPTKIIENDYHMSYPFLFEEGDDLYMIPETGSNKTIDLYKCTKFPYKWIFQKTLLKGIKAVDTTILKYKGKFWIFTNIKEIEGSSAHEELFLYFTDDLINGIWKDHPMNPIVSDVSCARSAGNIFIKDSKIYRPAQNCIKRYGYGLKFQEILILNEFNYKEKTNRAINPNWSKDVRGIHTFNKSGNFSIIDAIISRAK